MRKYLFILLVLVSCEPIIIESQGATYYVAPTTASPAGNNSNAGTIGAPWRTLTYAFQMVGAGDSILLRGGTYTWAMLGETSIRDNAGTSDNHIYIGPYNNEKPVFDFSAYNFTTYSRGIRLENTYHVDIEGIEIKNMRQADDGQSTNSGIYITGGVYYVNFKNMNVHHIGGWGLQFGNCMHLVFENCDFHHNSDPNSTGSSRAWDGGDGIQSASTSVVNVTFKGCRFYKNGDDGVDLLWVAGLVTFDNCWSFLNGYRPGETDSDADDMVTAGGNGEGFKMGMKASPDVTTTLRVIKNCLAFQNRLLGFHHYVDHADNEYEFRCEVYNNTAYRNGTGGGFNFGSQSTATDILRNNLCYDDEVYVNASNDDTYNSWNLSVSVSSADFVSISTTGMDGERNEDGSLPYLPFLRLHESSDLIDRGTDVGYSFNGSAPDLGAYESGEPIVIPPSDPDVSGLFRYHQGDTVWVFIKSGNKLLKKRE